MRAMMSGELPGGNGTTSLIGRAGQAWARADARDGVGAASGCEHRRAALHGSCAALHRNAPRGRSASGFGRALRPIRSRQRLRRRDAAVAAPAPRACAIGISTPSACARAAAPSAARSTPSATWPSSVQDLRRAPCPRASSRPTWRLRDRSPVAVSTRSPRPDRPMKVSARAPSATPSRVISARPRVTSAARAFRPRQAHARPSVADADRDREHVLDRAADLDADQVVGGVDAQRSRCAARRRPRRAAPRRALADDQRRRLAARDLDREARAGQHADPRTPGQRAARPRGRAGRCRCSKPLHSHSTPRRRAAPQAAQHRRRAPAIGVATIDQAAAGMARARRRSRRRSAAHGGSATPGR